MIRRVAKTDVGGSHEDRPVESRHTFGAEPSEAGHDFVDASGYVRRARRLADLSQRDLAAIVGIAQAGISRIESGHDLSVRDFERILSAAGLRLAILDDTRSEVAPMPSDVLRDRAGRRQPAHLDVHARPEFPTVRMLLRSVDPVPRPSWYHRRSERDQLRARTEHGRVPEQLTIRAVTAAKAAYRLSRAGPLPGGQGGPGGPGGLPAPRGSGAPRAPVPYA